MANDSSHMSALALDPVTVRIRPNGDVRLIASVHEVANFLLQEWPMAPDESFGVVAYACR
jgi:hypothetical protein